MRLPWYKQIPRTLLLLNIAVWIDVAWCVWLVQDIFPNFVVAEVIREDVRRIDDVVNLPYTSNKELMQTFDELVTIVSPEYYLLDRLATWQYKPDWPFWDVPTTPVISEIRGYGDCDDYARLAAYALHKGGYEEVYFVSMRAPKMGHAVAIYFDPLYSKYIMADINGWTELLVPEKKFPEDIYKLVRKKYIMTRYIAIRTWDLKTQLTIKEVRKKNEPAFSGN